MPQFERCYAQYSSTYTSVTDGLRRARQEDAPPHGHCRNAAPWQCPSAAPWQSWQRIGLASTRGAPLAVPTLLFLLVITFLTSAGYHPSQAAVDDFISGAERASGCG